LSVAVLGAGAFGAFTALALRRRGARVTLLDPWGPGNARASSGGETRVIRGVYGADAVYTQLAADAFSRWHEFERATGRKLLQRIGALWMVAGPDDSFPRQALPPMRAAGLAFEELAIETAARRWPQIRFDGIRSIFFEEGAGFLLARQACAAAVEQLVAQGGEYRALAAEPGVVSGGAMSTLRLDDGGALAADAYVFACGPWLGRLFPEVVGDRVRPTRQDVLFFGTPRGDRRFDDGATPIWIELGERFLYGIPGNERRGFKVADDTRGAPFDPTHGERTIEASSIAVARDLLARRFPGLTGAPLVETRVCQYENSPDSDFILDRHPGAANAWITGGGSGHGFKFAPAWGERVASAVLGERAVEPKFSLARFA
jgi:glycine/D-amino acid oxidase-like deaminating enzyme